MVFGMAWNVEKLSVLCSTTCFMVPFTSGSWKSCSVHTQRALYMHVPFTCAASVHL